MTCIHSGLDRVMGASRLFILDTTNLKGARWDTYIYSHITCRSTCTSINVIRRTEFRPRPRTWMHFPRTTDNNPQARLRSGRLFFCLNHQQQHTWLPQGSPYACPNFKKYRRRNSPKPVRLWKEGDMPELCGFMALEHMENSGAIFVHET